LDSMVHAVATRVLFLRHQRIMLDSDIAELYGVSVKRLNEQIKRINRDSPPISFFSSRQKNTRI
jgi:hypothetical protein